ncbi:tail fiber protein [Vibrio phage 166E36-1]
MAATDFETAVDQTITASAQLHEVVNGLPTETVATDSGEIPSVRKALTDSMMYLPSISWVQGEDETNLFQPRIFGDQIYWAPNATSVNPIPMGASPIGDSNWFLAPVSLNENFVREVSATTFNYDGLIYHGVGNISDFAGQQLQEADKTNAYQYPDNSRQFYVADKSQAFPITIPANPSIDNKWALVNALTPDALALYTGITYKASGGKSAVDNMILGIPVTASVGDKVKTGGTNWKRISNTNNDISDFKALTKVYVSDFGENRDSIQKALNVGSKAWCKAGVYYFSASDAPLEIPEGARLVGESEDTVIFEGSELVGPFIQNTSNRYLNSTIEGIGFEGNLSSTSNKGIVVNTGARHLVIRKNRFINIGSHCIHFNSGILGSGGFGSYYNTITKNTFGDALSSSVLVNGRALYVEGTANQNEFSWNTIRNTYLEGIRFDAISGNNFQCQNWDIYGNGIEGCGRTNPSEMAGVYLGDLTSNINIIMNYFERNGSDTAGGADVLANSPTTGIGTANVCRNLFAQSQYNIRARNYSGMNVHDNWRSGKVSSGGLYFFRIDNWNGVTGKQKFDLQGNLTHESCDIPFIQGSGLTGYPNSRGISGEIADSNSSLTPNLLVDGYAQREFDGVTSLFKTSGDGDVLDVKNSGGKVGSLFVSGGNVLGVKSEGIELYLNNATKRLQFGDSTFRPATVNDAQVDLGIGTARYRDLYIQNAPTVGSDIRYKKEITSIPQELIDFAMSQEIYQYKLKDGSGERNHYGIVITEEFIRSLNKLYSVGVCGALCYTLFKNENGDYALDTPDLYDEEGRWQVRYDEWQNILLEGFRRKIL